MIQFKKAGDLHHYLEKQRKQGKKYGFVPTMGALHPGHLSLLSQSTSNNDLTVCSIFVNPTQFNNPTDFEKYPVMPEKDIALLEGAGCDVLFFPPVHEMYPGGTHPAMHYELGYLETILEGFYRPGHFQGVCMVVHRLLEIVRPDNLYIGQKDYQQCMVIKKLLQQTGLADSISLHVSPTLREPDGLAMSSRNMRLSDGDRKKATAIYETLNALKKELQPGPIAALKSEAASNLEKKGFRVDYVEIADAADLHPAGSWNGKQKLVALAAAWLDNVRLIDNILLN